MYLITTSLYPNDKAKEVANIYLKAITKYPDDASLFIPIVPVAVRATLQGMRVISVGEVKKGKLESAHALTVNRMVMLHDIQGFKWTVKTYQNLEEALKTIGM
jgi:hypothetical protein